MFNIIRGVLHIYSVYKNPPDMEKDFLSLRKRLKNYSMTSVERMYSLYQSVKYITQYKIPGDFVECGVWKGGSSMLAATVLKNLKSTKRKLWLYDTFEGMPQPQKIDVNYRGTTATEKWQAGASKDHNEWDYAGLEEVKLNMRSTRYPEKNIMYVKGLVENTLKKTVPSKIAILRLDTDLYASTLLELKILYPRLVKGGVLIIDDYGHWKGSRKAVDEYFKDKKTPVLLNRIDYTGRISVKI